MSLWRSLQRFPLLSLLRMSKEHLSITPAPSESWGCPTHPWGFPLVEVSLVPAVSLSPLVVAPSAAGTGLVCPSPHCPFFRASLCLFSPQPSEVETDSEEYRSQNDTDLELEEQSEATVLEPSAVQVSVPAPFLGTASILAWKDLPQHLAAGGGTLGCSNLSSMNPFWILCCSDCVPVPHNAQGSVLPPELAAEDPAVASSGEEAPPDVSSDDSQKPQADGSSGDSSSPDTTCVTSPCQHGVSTIPPSEPGAGEVSQVPCMSPGSKPLSQSSAAKGKGWRGSSPCAGTQPQPPGVGGVVLGVPSHQCVPACGTPDPGLLPAGCYRPFVTPWPRYFAVENWEDLQGILHHKQLPWGLSLLWSQSTAGYPPNSQEAAALCGLQGSGRSGGRWGIGLSSVSVRTGRAMGKISCFPGKPDVDRCGDVKCPIAWDSRVPEGDVQLNAVFVVFCFLFLKFIIKLPYFFTQTGVFWLSVPRVGITGCGAARGIFPSNPS